MRMIRETIVRVLTAAQDTVFNETEGLEALRALIDRDFEDQEDRVRKVYINVFRLSN
jgi:hypothetical protein